jgi:uridine kinase
MKGDIILLEKHHRKAAIFIVSKIDTEIKKSKTRFTISIAGESGSGKSEMAVAIAEGLLKQDITTLVFGQDDYFNLPPKSNDARRREDPEWLGPHVEVDLETLEKNLSDAKSGKNLINKPIVDYDKNSIEREAVDLTRVKVIIAEGTYTSLLRNIDKKIFITGNRLDTLEHRRKRNRGSEVGDPFIEHILDTEHKIIAGHKFLADFIITKDFDVVAVK